MATVTAMIILDQFSKIQSSNRTFNPICLEFDGYKITQGTIKRKPTFVFLLAVALNLHMVYAILSLMVDAVM